MAASTKYFYAALLASLFSGNLLPASAAGSFQTEHQPAAITVLPYTESVLGKTLVGTSGETIGRIVDVLTDETGQVQAVLVDYGGFLGIGARKIAIAWSGLRFGSAGNPDAVWASLSRESLARAPAVKAGQPVIAISTNLPGGHRSARH